MLKELLNPIGKLDTPIQTSAGSISKIVEASSKMRRTTTYFQRHEVKLRTEHTEKSVMSGL